MKWPGMAIRWTSTVAVAMVGPVLVGCGGAPTDGHSREGGAVVVQVSKEARPASARPYIGKPRPPVEVLLKAQPELQPGVPGELGLVVKPGIPLTRLSLVAEGDSGLTVTGLRALPYDAGRREEGAVTLNMGQLAEYKVFVTPSSGGSLSVSGRVSFVVGGVEQAAPFRLNFRVPGGPGPTEETNRQGNAGRKDRFEEVYAVRGETTVVSR